MCSATWLFIAVNVYFGNSYIMNNECDCTISVLSSSATYDEGYLWTGQGVTSDTTDPLGPWYNESVAYLGTSNGGEITVYEYQINCNLPCWIQSITIDGIAFHNARFTFYNGDGSSTLNTLDVNTGNVFASHTMDMSSNEFYATSFRFKETNDISWIRYRTLITMTMVAAATPTPTSPTVAPTAPTQSPTIAECDCEISVVSASTTYPVGSPFLNVTSDVSDPIGPWYGESVKFKGTDDAANSDQIVYDYAIDCQRSCWITSITVKGAAFYSTQFTLYNGDKSAVIDTLSVDTPNEFASHTMDMRHSSHEYYGNSFRFVEQNNICCVRYRSFISMTVSIEPTSNPTMDPTIDPTDNPTSNPSNEPTAAPTKEPTSTPTKEPTEQSTTTTTEPSSDPTIDPTIDPTKDPTKEPTSHIHTTSDSIPNSTINLTDDPTSDPTSNPTTDPTMQRTLDPTQDHVTTYTSYSVTTSTSTEILSSTQLRTTTMDNNPNDPLDGQIEDATDPPLYARDGNEANVVSESKSLDQNVMIIIIVCSIVLVLCILLIVFVKWRKSAQKDQQNLAKQIPTETQKKSTAFNTTDNITRIASTSTSPVSMQSQTANQGNLMNFVGVNDMMMDDVVNEMEHGKTPGYDGYDDNDTQIIIGETELMEGGVNNEDSKAHLSDFEIEMEEIVSTPNGYDNVGNYIDSCMTPKGMDQGVGNNQNIANDEFIIDADEDGMERIIHTPQGNDDNDNDDDVDLTDITPM